MNAILSTIAVILVDKADVYWKKQQDAPTNLFSLCMIGTILKISVIVAKIVGVAIGLYWAISSKKAPSKEAPKFLSPLIKFFSAVLQVLLFVPLFIYIFVLEVRFRIIHRNQ